MRIGILADIHEDVRPGRQTDFSIYFRLRSSA
jgi:hypothetical protein